MIMMMSGDGCWNKNVFSRWRKVAKDGDDWTWTGKVFQTVAAVTGNERRLMVVGEWDVMWVSHLCGSGRYVGFVPGRRGVRSEPAL